MTETTELTTSFGNPASLMTVIGIPRIGMRKSGETILAM